MNRVALALRNRPSMRPLLGIALHQFDMRFAEMVGLMGFHSLWIEMEHLTISFREAADLCRLGSAMGLLTMIRIPDARRETVLKAAECGPDIVDLPMGDSPEQLSEFVRHARYAPAGERGFFSSARAMRYGLYNDLEEERLSVNASLCLMSQIETRQAVERREELCRVPGIDAIFIGPGDLSASYGLPGKTSHPVVMGAMDQAIAAARSHGRIVAMAGAAADAKMWAEKGVDILYCGSDTACLRSGAEAIIADVRRSLQE